MQLYQLSTSIIVKKKPLHGYQNDIPIKICKLSYDWYVKVRKYLNIKVIFWVYTNVNNIDAMEILPTWEKNWMACRPDSNGIENKKSEYPYFIDCNKYKIFILET